MNRPQSSLTLLEWIAVMVIATGAALWVWAFVHFVKKFW